MPELPEVETVRRSLEPAVVGRRVLDARFTPEGDRLLQGVPTEAFRSAISGRRIAAAGRPRFKTLRAGPRAACALSSRIVVALGAGVSYCRRSRASRPYLVDP